MIDTTEQALSIIESDSYFNKDIRYLSGNIVEYDIASANISILRQFNAIDENYYNYLARLPKLDREIEIGLLCKDLYDKDGNLVKKSEFGDLLKAGFLQARQEFVKANNIKAEEIVRVAKDAIYINRPILLKNTSFGYINFRIKMMASVVVKISNQLIIFYWSDNNGINIDVVGLGKNKEMHQNHMLSFIASVIHTAERSSIKDALNLITDFYNRYINLELDINFYRELNSGSMFKIKNSGFYVFDSNAISMEAIDISFNCNIIRELWSIILSKYN